MPKPKIIKLPVSRDVFLALRQHGADLEASLDLEHRIAMLESRLIFQADIVREVRVMLDTARSFQNFPNWLEDLERADDYLRRIETWEQ